MAKQSRAKIYTGQLKRQNRKMMTLIEQLEQGQARATALVLGCLVQAGGDITFSQATTNRMNTDIARMGYKIVPDAEGLVKVVLVYQEEQVESTEPSDSTIPNIDVKAPVKQWNGEAVGKILLTD